MDWRLVSLEKGKGADLIIVVETAIIDGKVVVGDEVIRIVDETEVIKAASESSKALLELIRGY